MTSRERRMRALTEQAVNAFEKAADELYDPEDAARGYVEVADRRNNIRRADLVTVSIGVLSGRDVLKTCPCSDCITRRTRLQDVGEVEWTLTRT